MGFKEEWCDECIFSGDEDYSPRICNCKKAKEDLINAKLKKKHEPIYCHDVRDAWDMYECNYIIKLMQPRTGSMIGVRRIK
jgi:hypothetical protein